MSVAHFPASSRTVAPADVELDEWVRLAAAEGDQRANDGPVGRRRLQNFAHVRWHLVRLELADGSLVTLRRDAPFRVDHRPESVTVRDNSPCFHLSDMEGNVIDSADCHCPAAGGRRPRGHSCGSPA